MKNSSFKKFFPKLSSRDISVLGLLMAITALLAIFCTFRLGTIVKIPTKFISVFITAFLYGPFYGGLSAAVGDILNCILAPVGPFVPQITFMEFVSGFIFGLFFLKENLSKTEYAVRIILCVFVHLFIDLVLNTAMYTFWLGWFSTFWTAFFVRTPASVIKLFLQLFLLLSIHPLLNRLKSLNQKGAKGQ